MSDKINMVGLKFGTLTVLAESDIRGNDGGIRVECVCECGKKTTVRGKDLRLGKTKTCGQGFHKYKGGRSRNKRGSLAWATHRLAMLKTVSEKQGYCAPIATAQEVQALWVLAAGRCAITGECFSKKNMPCLDHCHVTGKLRGFIGRKANLAIGNLGDDPYLALAAYQYLVLPKLKVFQSEYQVSA